MGLAYYNEHDPFAAEWLRKLIDAGEIATGVVDERSIVDVQPQDLDGYTQCHFFAGIGGWSLALRLAGWPDDQPVWTGSCPCQPFSVAGKNLGEKDERHLWPEFARLIGQRRPPVVFGEQVASTAGRGWLAAVRLDLERLGYGVGSADLCAAGVGAPHIRQRLWWGGFAVHGLADADDNRRDPGLAGDARGEAGPRGAYGDVHDRRGGARGLADADGGDPGAERLQRGGEHRQRTEDSGAVRRADLGARGDLRPRLARTSSAHAPWGAADWLFCRDGKWRPVEPGTFPLAHGLPARMGRLRAYGNAIVPQVAAAFIRSFQEAIEEVNE